MRVFIALPQYKEMPVDIEIGLADALGFRDWKPFGIHPKVSYSLAKLRNTGHEYVLNILRNDGMIERSRSTLFGAWLCEWNKGNRFDYFMCLDEDIEFPEDAIPKLIESGRGIIGGAYAYKVNKGAKAGKSVCKYLPGEQVGSDGIIKIRWLNGGFIICRADALFKMMEHYPDLKYKRFGEGDGSADIIESYAFWMAMVHTIETGDRILLSEDYAFTQRATDAGIDIWLDTTIGLTHWAGTTPYTIGRKDEG